MASISSSFNCLALASNSTSSSSSFAPVRSVRFQNKMRPISAVCATAEPLSATSSLYELLGVESGASCKEIKTAYRRLARVLHPDVASSSSSSNGQYDVASASDFIRVHEAYSTLSDPAKRADYDRALFIRRRLMNGSTSSFATSVRVKGPTAARFTRRSWETDQCW